VYSPCQLYDVCGKNGVTVGCNTKGCKSNFLPNHVCALLSEPPQKFIKYQAEKKHNLLTHICLNSDQLMTQKAKKSIKYYIKSQLKCDRLLSVVVVPRPSTFLLKHLILWNRSLDFDQTSQEWSLGCSLPQLFKPFQLIAYVGHGVKKTGFQNANFKNKCFCLKLQLRHRAFIFGIKHHLEFFYQSCSSYALGVKIDPAPGVTILHLIYKEKFKRHLFLNSTQLKIFIA